jgi:1,2-diacylglycerol 3-beta-galactosyltransferase
MIAARALDREPREAQIDLISFDFGGGHRASATALKAVVEQQRRPWRIRMVNLRDELEPLDFLFRVTGVRLDDFYNGLISHGLPISTRPMLRAVQMLIRAAHRRQVELLTRYWQQTRPDLVLSLVPNFNRAIFDGLRAADLAQHRAATPMITILTDLADCPPHFWIEAQDQYVICGTGAAAEQALAMGNPADRVFRTSGMIVRPEFYRPLEISREQERRRIGLHPELPTGLVMFGGAGSPRMATIARRVSAANLNTQLIFICGRNQRLLEQLAAMALPFPHHIEGFTREIPYFMQLADFFIGKPGPGCISEALVMGLPVIVEHNARTMVQERYNAGWIVQNELGVVLDSFADIAKGIAPMLDREQLTRFRAHAHGLNIRAVFEIPEIIETLLARHAHSRPTEDQQPSMQHPIVPSRVSRERKVSWRGYRRFLFA